MKNSFKVFKKSEGKFLDGVYTPYNCLCKEHSENDLIFIPFVTEINGFDLFEGDVVRYVEPDYLSFCEAGATYFAVVEFNENDGCFLFKEINTNIEYGLDAYDFEEITGHKLTNPEFFKEEQEIK